MYRRFEVSDVAVALKIATENAQSQICNELLLLLDTEVVPTELK